MAIMLGIRPHVNQSQSPSDNGSVSAIDEPTSQPDQSLATHLIDQVLSSAHQVGLLSAFRRDHRKAVAAPDDFSLLANPALQSALLVYSLLCGSERQDSRCLAGKCRTHALADISALVAGSRSIHRGDLYCLYILANLGYLHEATTEMALRWAAMAGCLESVFPQHVGMQDYQQAEAYRRVKSLLDMNSYAQMLLYNRPVANDMTSNTSVRSQNQNEPSKPQEPDHEWHQHPTTTLADVVFADASEGFFELFLPLQAPLKVALTRPAHDTSAYRGVVDCLEQYFIAFPTRLMTLSNVVTLWQFEAMIWFHGIFILLNTGPNFLEILVDPGFLRGPSCTRAADHAILLGDIIASLKPTTFNPSQLSHVTIFFIALSSTIHASLLPLIYLERLPVPDVFLGSAQVHQGILETILTESQSCDHPLIQVTQKILSFNIQQACGSLIDEEIRLAEFLLVLKYYRWTSEGCGLIKLNDDAATRLLQATTEKLHHDSTTSVLAPNLLSLFDPNRRICRPDTFNLSILY
ncbi:hypothetical protein GQ44DRAFT_702276 [Phaeosphaeriaceae sp. PMI808]|nr:hypothetical protein GQ44DRAFT_702276 [Phaeosphaeriaceae sp. PMI808]